MNLATFFNTSFTESNFESFGVGGFQLGDFLVVLGQQVQDVVGEVKSLLVVHLVGLRQI